MLPRRPVKEDFITKTRVADPPYSLNLLDAASVERIDYTNNFPCMKLTITYKEPFFDEFLYREAVRRYNQYLAEAVEIFDQSSTHTYSNEYLEILKEYCEDQVLRLNDIIKYCEHNE